MRPSWRRGSIVVALLGCVGFAAMQSKVGTEIPTAGSIFDNMDETTGSLATPEQRHELPLSDEQRSRVYDGLMRMSDAPVARVPAPELADALASEVVLEDLPAGVTGAIPLVQGHKFVKFEDRILVVEPASRRIVVMIPRYRLLK